MESSTGDNRVLENRLRNACAELDSRIRSGADCRAEEYVSTLRDSGLGPEGLLELIYTEFMARERRGERVREAELYERFPEWRDSLERLFELHELARDGDSPTINRGSTIGGDDRAARIATVTSLSGARIGQYELLEAIGHGGMGVVYKARQLKLDRIVAVKMILTMQATPMQRARFRQEAETVARLHHPNIVQIHEVGEESGCAYLSMEYVDGNSLEDEIVRTRFPARAAAALVETLAEAMHYAHGLGIIHRDLKPANVLIQADGAEREREGTRGSFRPRSVFGIQPKITDFGLAKHLTIPGYSALGGNRKWPEELELTATGQILGTPGYMAPEQTSGRNELLGPTTDVYGLGAILYATLCGHSPFRGATALDTIELVRQQEPVPPSRHVAGIARDLETICLKCLAKEPHRRYATAEQLAADLRRFLDGQPIRARAVGWLERTSKWARRRPAAASLIAAMALSFVGVTSQWIRAESSRAAAVAAAHTAELASKAEQAERERVEGLLYAHDVALAAHEYTTNNTHRALQLLDGTRIDLRHWEWRLLNRLCRGEQVSFKADGVEHASVAMSHDGRLVAVAGYLEPSPRVGPGVVTVWDSVAGVERFRLPARPSPFSSSCIEFSRDGNRLASVGNEDPAGVTLWDMADGSQVYRISTGRVHNLAFSPDGKWLACGQQDGPIVIYDAASGEKVRSLTGHFGLVLGVKFSPSGERVASAGRDGTARIWDTSSGTELEVISGLRDVRCLDYAPDGRRLAVGNWDGFVKIYNLSDSGVCSRTPDGSLQVASYSRAAIIKQLAWTPDGQRLAVLPWGEALEVWDAASGKPQRVIHGDHSRATFSPDGRRLITGGHDQVVKIWDFTSDPLPHRWMGHPTGAIISDMAFSADGKQLAITAGGATSYAQSQSDFMLRLVDMASRQVTKQFRGHTGWLTGVAFSPNGKQLVTSSEDKTLKIWDIDREEVVRTLEGHEDAVTCVKFNNDGSRVASAGKDRSVRIWDADRGKPIHIMMGHDETVRSILFQPGSRVLASADAGGAIRLWDSGTGRQLAEWSGHQGPVNELSFATKELLVSCGDDARIRCWEMSSLLAGEFEPFRTLDAHSQATVSVCATPDGKRLASVGFRSVKLWDIGSGQERLGLPVPANPVSRIRFDPNGQVLLSTHNEDLIAWDPGTDSPEVPESQAPSQAIAWHMRQSDIQERSQQWFGVAFHRSQLARLEPEVWQHPAKRGEAHMALQEWTQACDDYTRATELGGDFTAWYLRTLLRLRTDNLEGYRSSCEGLMGRFGESADGRIANAVAWACSLSPQSGVDPARLIALAKVGVADLPSPGRINTLGAALYRAAQFQEAEKRLMESLQLQADGGDPMDWFFVALTKHAIGELEEARKWFKMGAQYMDDALIDLRRSKPDPWLTDRREIALRALRREAEQLLWSGADKPAAEFGN
jgi:WD40 repeat protein/serine/threonine protein kinase